MSSKYTSIQNECLDLIEAYSEEQYHAEMAVIDSVLDMFDKISCLMEYSNPDNISIPDCSMFMESTFFQESENDNGNAETNTSGDETSVDNKEQTQSEPQQQQQQNTQDQTNNTTNQTNTNTNREQYNKNHPFRKMNDKGKIENIFISILKFIPRLLKFIFNKITKSNDTSALTNEATSSTPEERQQVIQQLQNVELPDGVSVNGNNLEAAKDNETASLDINNMTVNIEETGSGEKIEEIAAAANKLANADLNSPQQIIQQPSEQSQTNSKRVSLQLTSFEKEKEKYNNLAEQTKKELEEAIKRINAKIEELEKASNDKSTNLAIVIKNRKADVIGLNNMIKRITIKQTKLNIQNSLVTKVLSTYVKELKNIRNNSVGSANEIEKTVDQNIDAVNNGKSIKL